MRGALSWLRERWERWGSELRRRRRRSEWRAARDWGVGR